MNTKTVFSIMSLNHLLHPFQAHSLIKKDQFLQIGITSGEDSHFTELDQLITRLQDKSHYIGRVHNLLGAFFDTDFQKKKLSQLRKDHQIPIERPLSLYSCLENILDKISLSKQKLLLFNFLVEHSRDLFSLVQSKTKEDLIFIDVLAKQDQKYNDENLYLRINFEQLNINYGGLNDQGLALHELIQRLNDLAKNNNITCIEITGIGLTKRATINRTLSRNIEDFYLCLNLLLNKINSEMTKCQ